MNKIAQHNAYITKLKASIPSFGELEGKAKFLAHRRLGIGGSDVAAIMGINKYKTSYAVWLEKTGREDPQEETKSMYFGKVLENVVADEYARVTGNAVHRVNQPITCKLKPWLTANLDRRVVGEKKVLECKTANPFAFKAEQWGKGNQYLNIEPQTVITCDAVPDAYLLQCQHYLTVTGYLEADLAVLIGGNDFRIYTIKHNTMLSDIVCERLTDFWFNHVIADIPPTPETLLEVDEFYGGNDNGQSITATPAVMQAIHERKKAIHVKKQAEALIHEQETTIKLHMGENQLLIDDSGKKLASWKTQVSNRFNTAEFRNIHPELANQFTRSVESRIFR